MSLYTIFKNKWFALGILLIATILSPLDFYIVNLALTPMQQGLNASSSQLQMIVSFYTCAYAVFQISGGRFGDLYGRKKMFCIGLIGFVSSSVLCGVSPNATVMIIGRVLQGVFGAVMIPQVLAIIHLLFDDTQKRKVMALYSFTFGIAAALGQYLGAVLIELNLFNLGWRIIFLINLPIGILALIGAIIALPNKEKTDNITIDYMGTVLMSLGLVAFIYPLTTIGDNGFDISTAINLISAVILLTLFVKLENKRRKENKSILIDFSIFKFKNLRFGVIIAFLYYCSGIFYLALGIYLQEELKWTAMEAGKAIIPFGFGFLVMSLSSSVINKLLKNKALAIGLLIYSLGFVCIILDLFYKLPIVFKLGLFFAGSGMGLTLASVVRLTLLGIPQQFAGLASGLINCSLQTGSAFGVASLGSIFFIIARKSNFTIAFASVLAITILLLLIAVILSLKMKDTHPSKPM